MQFLQVTAENQFESFQMFQGETEALEQKLREISRLYDLMEADLNVLKERNRIFPEDFSSQIYQHENDLENLDSEFVQLSRKLEIVRNFADCFKKNAQLLSKGVN